MTGSDDGGGTLTLRTALDRLSPVVLELVDAPSGPDAPIHRVVIAAVGDDAAIASGDLVLLVGADPYRPEGDGAVARAAAVGATAVVLKLRPDQRGAARELARRCGIAVVATPLGADWGQLFTLVRTLLDGSDAGGASGDHTDLFAFANAIAGATGGATTIEDRQLRVVAYSNLEQPIDHVRRDSILGRSVPDYVMERDDMVALYRRMWGDTDIVRLEPEDDNQVRARLGAPVRAGDEVIGTIWVVEGDTPLDERAERVLRESGPRAALLLLQHQTAGDRERRRRSDAVRTALDGTASVPIPLKPGEQLRVVALGMRPGTAPDAASLLVRRQRLVDLASFQFELFDPRSAAVAVDDAVLVILPEGATGSRRHREIVADVAQRATHALKTEVLAGVGGPATDPPALVRSRWEAEEALAVAAEGGAAARSPRVVSIDDVRSAVVLRRLRSLLADDERCRTPSLDVLLRHDAEQHTDHLATLGAYLDAFGDVSRAAAALDIHPNTLRYRLKRIVELVGVDLTDPVARFVLELQWRLR